MEHGCGFESKPTLQRRSAADRQRELRIVD
jgi:hypothetical protein